MEKRSTRRHLEDNEEEERQMRSNLVEGERGQKNGVSGETWMRGRGEG